MGILRILISDKLSIRCPPSFISLLVVFVFILHQVGVTFVEEMMDKYGATPYLLVGQSTALIMQEQYEEAEKLLQVHLQLTNGRRGWGKDIFMS